MIGDDRADSNDPKGVLRVPDVSIEPATESDRVLPTAAPAPVSRRRRQRTRHRLRVTLGYTGGIVLGVATWQIIGLNSQPLVFVPLTETLRELGSMLAGDTLRVAMVNSFATFAMGMAFALTIGAAMGLLLARSRTVRVALEPYIMGLYAAPMVALIPFFLALMGFTFWPKSIVVALFAVFPVILNTQRGAQSIARELLDVARVYRSPERSMWVHVIIPYTLPFFMTGVRQALARGLVGMIAADMFLSANGLGGLLISASQFFDTAQMLATMIIITFAGILLMALGRWVENRFSRWQVHK